MEYKGAASEGGRAMQLMKKRKLAQEELELRKKKIESELKIHDIDNKFSAHCYEVEGQLKTSTIGLVSLSEMKEKQQNLVHERERKIALKENEKERQKQKAIAAKKAEKEKRKRQIQALSFDVEDEDDASVDESEDSTKSNDSKSSKDLSVLRITKNPDVDTSFLRDKEREDEDNKIREELRQEWVMKQNILKEEDIKITFSYWDGAGHRRSVTMKKGHSIYQLLQACLLLLRKDFSELKNVTADQLMYVKEDLILPQYNTFYDFIVTKARGKSGPLFHFDVHDDVRLKHDASVETEESHAGKILLRSWYERHKHMFPACRWEHYDPTKTYEKYTVSDKNKK